MIMINVVAFRRGHAFSLVEVVLALGVVSFAIVAILGVVPLGLQTGHDAANQSGTDCPDQFQQHSGTGSETL